MKKERYRHTINFHGLRDYDVESVSYVFEATSPKDALRRVDKVYKLSEQSGKKLSFYAKQFLEAVAISAQTDIVDPLNS